MSRPRCWRFGGDGSLLRSLSDDAFPLHPLFLPCCCLDPFAVHLCLVVVVGYSSCGCLVTGVGFGVVTVRGLA